MEKEQIHLSDVKRILLGEGPPEFLLEVFLRTLIIYLAMLFLIKWLGKRMSGQLSITEMAIMIMIGAIISVPMQVAENGILQGLLVMLCLLGIYNLLNWLNFKNKRLEILTQGGSVLLVKDHVLQLKQMKRSRVSRQQLFAVLRNENIMNLGEVKRVYLEGCGIFSILREEKPHPGLPVFPPADEEVLRLQSGIETRQACASCGFVKDDKPALCEHCGNNEWISARIVNQHHHEGGN